jgi:hypothetical protein
MIYDDTINVSNVANWIKYDVFSSMKPELTASTAINNENSLICPNLKPVSYETYFFSPSLRNNQAKISGLQTSTRIARVVPGISISLITDKLKPAPKEKKNIIRKKSRSGFNRSVINNAIGLGQCHTCDKRTDFMRQTNKMG